MVNVDVHDESVAAVLLGVKSSEEDIVQVNEALLATPGALMLRARLLGFLCRRKPRTQQHEELYIQQVHWFIDNNPRSSVLQLPYATACKYRGNVGYNKLREAWISQAARSNSDPWILANAAYFLAAEEPKFAEDLFQKAVALDPNSALLHQRLARLYMRTRGDWEYAPTNALRELRIVFAMAPSKRAIGTFLADAAQAAFDCGAYDEAREYAEEILMSFGGVTAAAKRGARVAYTILGRLAFRMGDEAKARDCLVSACVTAPDLRGVFLGPDMTLAQELLDAGERKAVVEFLRGCGKTWPSVFQTTNSLIAAIEAGQELSLNMALSLPEAFQNNVRHAMSWLAEAEDL